MKPYCYVTKIFIKLTQSAKKTKDGKKNDEYTDENRKTLSAPYRKRRMCCCVQPLDVSSSSVNRTLKNLLRVLSHTQLLAEKILSVYCPRERDGVYVLHRYIQISRQDVYECLYECRRAKKSETTVRHKPFHNHECSTYVQVPRSLTHTHTHENNNRIVTEGARPTTNTRKYKYATKNTLTLNVKPIGLPDNIKENQLECFSLLKSNANDFLIG